MVSRLLGRRCYAQSSINAYYEPPEFLFADRYAYMLKIAAMVLVFAPAVPLLYWLGGGTLLFSWYIQNLALVKIYRRPKSLDHHVAERSRSFLCVLLFLHVASSTAFYTRQAYVTGATWDAEAQLPFTLSFLFLLFYLLLEARPRPISPAAPLACCPSPLLSRRPGPPLRPISADLSCCCAG